ncbi:zinc finger, BED-type [Artemisia annua]|uniref:Zinc finger, BED-type n=1 Tax=Artemisia annua TaxID=35608 RepID=A0A2U1QH60_ARTAN|nr:zinc finger, BED-type [Artemisia annua]
MEWLSILNSHSCVYLDECADSMELSEEMVFVDCSRLKSAVWKDFDRVKRGDACVAICKHCKKKLSGSMADCKELYLKEKQKVREMLKYLSGKISLSVDTYAAKGEAKYLSLTAHAVDDSWALKKKVLSFVYVDPFQTEDMVTEAIMSKLMEWDIDRKLFSMTCDSCLIHDNIVGKIREQLSQNRFLLCNGQLFEVRCAVNLIKVMVEDCLDALSLTICKIRETVRYIRSSQTVSEKFNEMVQEVEANNEKPLYLGNEKALYNGHDVYSTLAGGSDGGNDSRDRLTDSMELSEEMVFVDCSRLKSAVWKDFDRVKRGDACVAICKHCKKKLSGSMADCKELYLKEKQKVREMLKYLSGKISLSVDTYAAKGEAKYLSLTAHAVDDSWALKKKVLSFVYVDPFQTEDMVTEAIMSKLMEWDIDRKLFSMTCDSCLIHDNIVGKIREQLSQNRFLLCNGQLFEVRCAVNLIKVMVEDCLDALSLTICKIRETVRYIRSSQTVSEKFNEMVQEVEANNEKPLYLGNEKALYNGHDVYSTLAGGSDGGNDSRDRLTGFDRFILNQVQARRVYPSAMMQIRMKLRRFMEDISA